MKEVKKMWKQYYNYMISDKGEVKNLSSQTLLKGNKKKNGYIEYCLYIDGERKYKLIRRLVAELFIENPLNFDQVNHKDGNKENNHIKNLEWVNSSKNNAHAWENNLNKPHVLRVVNQYDLNYNFIKTFESVAEAARKTGANRKGISAVCLGKQKKCFNHYWKFFNDDIVQ